MSARRSTALLAAVWLAGVGMATGTGVLAVHLVARQVGDPSVTVLSASDVGRQLAAAPSPTSKPAHVAGGQKPQAVKPPAGTTTTAKARASAHASSAPARPKHRSGPSTATSTRHDGSSSTSPRTGPSGGSGTPRTSAVKAFDSQGGSVGVRCRGTSPEQVYATPAQDYRLEDSRTNGSTLEVTFRSSTTDVDLEIDCRSGSPVLTDSRVSPESDVSSDSEK